jgi:hypothetical protein
LGAVYSADEPLLLAWPLELPLQLLSVLLRLPPLSPLVLLPSRQGLVEAVNTTRMPMLAEPLRRLWLRPLRPGLRLAHRFQQRC